MTHVVYNAYLSVLSRACAHIQLATLIMKHNNYARSHEHISTSIYYVPADLFVINLKLLYYSVGP